MDLPRWVESPFWWRFWGSFKCEAAEIRGEASLVCMAAGGIAIPNECGSTRAFMHPLTPDALIGRVEYPVTQIDLA